MKKTLLILILYFTCGEMYSQSYTPYPTDSTVWLTANAYSLSPMGVTVNFYFGTQYVLDGSDTIANGYTYKKITREFYGGYGYINAPVPAIANDLPRYFGAVRENANRQVYFLDTLGNEHLILDFNTNLYNVYTTYQSSCPMIVTAIDSVLITSINEYRKRYFFQFLAPCSANANSQYVEGIGFLNHGLFYTGQALVCFKWKGQVLYSRVARQSLSSGIFGDNGQSCHEVYPYGSNVGIQEYEKESIILNIYPNPSSNGVVTIEMNQDISAQIIIYNALGQLVFERFIDSKTNTLTTQGFAKGLYYVIIKTENQKYTQRLIIE